MLSYLPTLTLLATTAFSLPTTTPPTNNTNTTTPSDLAPWQLTTLNTHVPSGRPGNSPYTTLNFSITSTTPASAASCSAQWIGAAEFPVGVDTPCTTSGEGGAGEWSFAITGGSGASDFELKVELKTQDGGEKYVAEEKFAVGDNLSGVCGGSGVCNWGLKTAPFELVQEEVEEDGDEE